jgi:hypothetical protein
MISLERSFNAIYTITIWLVTIQGPKCIHYSSLATWYNYLKNKSGRLWSKLKKVFYTYLVEGGSFFKLINKIIVKILTFISTEGKTSFYNINIRKILIYN